MSRLVGASPPSRVLIVEDDEAIGTLLADALDGAGYEVLQARGDREAYAALKGGPRGLDALVLDIDLGAGTTGFDVARRARALDPGVKVLFVSGVANAASVARFGVPGALFLGKPMDVPEVLTALSTLLGPRR